MPEVRFVPLRPHHVHALELQPSQARPLGLEYEPGPEQLERMCSGPIAWAALEIDGDHARVVACFGVVEQFAGVHATGWAMLAEGIGGAHLAVTRFARACMATCELPRVELLARCHDVEGILSRHADLDPGQVVAIAAAEPTAEIRWGLMLGFAPAHVLRCYGANGESVMLMERIAPQFRGAALREAA